MSNAWFFYGKMQHFEGEFVNNCKSVKKIRNTMCSNNYHLSDQVSEALSLPLVPRVIPWNPAKKNTFQPEFCDEVCTIYVHYKSHNSVKKKNVRFQHGSTACSCLPLVKEKCNCYVQNCVFFV